MAQGQSIRAVVNSGHASKVHVDVYYHGLPGIVNTVPGNYREVDTRSRRETSYTPSIVWLFTCRVYPFTLYQG